MTLGTLSTPIHLVPNVIGQNQRVQMILQNRAMNFGGFQPMLSRVFSVSNLCMRFGSSLWYLSERIAEIIGLVRGGSRIEEVIDVGKKLQVSV